MKEMYMIILLLAPNPNAPDLKMSAKAYFDTKQECIEAVIDYKFSGVKNSMIQDIEFPVCWPTYRSE